MAGLRAPVFALAAIEGVPFATFVFWDALIGLVTVPLVFGLGYLFSSHVAAVEANLAPTEHWIAAGLGLAALCVSWFSSRRRKSK